MITFKERRVQKGKQIKVFNKFNVIICTKCRVPVDLRIKKGFFKIDLVL